MTSSDPSRAVAAAVADNVAWCEAVCRSLGRRTGRTAHVWSSPDPPRWFPHRITLDPGTTAEQVLAGLDGQASCWVKDSHASLALDEHGFVPVVDAWWTCRPPGAPAGTPDWTIVRSPDEPDEPDELAAWTSLTGLTDVVTPRLAACPSVRLVTVRERGRPVGAAALSTGADVVGVSCVVSHGQDPDATWAAVVHAATQLFPGRLLVGYESGEDLDAARRAGFTPTGPVRIWHRP